VRNRSDALPCSGNAPSGRTQRIASKGKLTLLVILPHSKCSELGFVTNNSEL